MSKDGTRADMERRSEALRKQVADTQRRLEPCLSTDDGCICKGNWRVIVSETYPLLDKQFVCKHDNTIWTFFGVVYASDDYYYGMSSKAGLRLLSCVGNFEGHGYEPLVNEAPVA